MWQDWNIGDRIEYSYSDFDGHDTYTGVVTEKHTDHLIITSDGMNLWCDKYTQDMFRKVWW